MASRLLGVARPSLMRGRVASLSGICSAALCNTAMNIVILKWVLTDLMTCTPQHTLHAVSQLDANGIVTKHVKNASI